MTHEQPTLVLLGEPRPGVEIVPMEPALSALTGKSLRRVAVRIRTADKQQNEQLVAELDSHNGKKALIADTSGARWQVAEHSWSYTSGNGPVSFSHDVKLQEHQELTVQRLEFGGIVLSPDRWTFDSRDDASILTIIVDVELEAHNKLERFLADRRAADDRHFPVKWIGATEHPISMRFGHCVWQPMDGGGVRHLLNLVKEETPDAASPFDLLFQPERARLLESSIRTGAKIDALISELHRAGVLDDAAVSRIEDRAANPPTSAAREFERADDAEAFLI